MMVTVPHVTSGLGLRKFQPDGFLLIRVYLGPTPLNDTLPNGAYRHLTKINILKAQRPHSQQYYMEAAWAPTHSSAVEQSSVI